MKYLSRSLFVSLMLVAVLSGCKTREEKIDAAVEKGDKDISVQLQNSNQEINKAQQQGLEKRVEAANVVTEAERNLEDKKIASVEAAATAQAKVEAEVLAGKKAVTEVQHEAERNVEKAAE